MAIAAGLADPGEVLEASAAGREEIAEVFSQRASAMLEDITRLLEQGEATLQALI